MPSNIVIFIISTFGLIALSIICSTIENIAKTKITAKAKIEIAKAGGETYGAYDPELAASPDRSGIKAFEWKDPQG